MAFANIGSVEGQFNQNATSDTTSAAIPSLGANRVGIVLVNRQHNSDRTITGVTWNGDAMTQAIVEDTDAQFRSAIFYLIECDHNGTYNIVVSYNSTGVAHISHVTVVWADATGAITIDDTSSAQGTTTNPTITSTQAGANELVVSGSAKSSNSISSPSVTDCTELQNYDAGPYCFISAYSVPGSSGDVTHQHNYGSSATYAITSASFKEESAGGSAIAAILNSYRQRRA